METKIDLFKRINDKFTEEEILRISPLQLAYVGDAVYELLVRSYILDLGLNVNELHRKAIDFVKAESQAKYVFLLEDFFTEKESQLIRRGRNAKSNTNPKNVDISSYRYSTGFEAMIGYLYLTGENERILEIFREIIKLYEEDEVEG